MVIMRVNHKREPAGENVKKRKRATEFLEGPHEEVEIQRKALRRGKSLALSEDTCAKMERVQSKMTPRKGAVGLKRRGKLKNMRWGWTLA